MTDNNYSINNLIGTFATISTGTNKPIPNSIVCVDTSNNRIGINTIDPSYSLHVVGYNNDATISTKHLIVNDDTTSKIIFKNLPTSNIGLELGQLYNDAGTLKVKI